MAIELMNCKGMFSDSAINDFKKHIDDYHQGFMIVNDELYLPRYKVVSLGLDYDEDTEVVVLNDYDRATAKDKLAKLFNDNECVSNEELTDLAKAVWSNDIDGAYQLMLDICRAKYWQGYHDGFNRGA